MTHWLHWRTNQSADKFLLWWNCRKTPYLDEGRLEWKKRPPMKYHEWCYCVDVIKRHALIVSFLWSVSELERRELGVTEARVVACLFALEKEAGVFLAEGASLGNTVPGIAFPAAAAKGACPVMGLHKQVQSGRGLFLSHSHFLKPKLLRRIAVFPGRLCRN